MFNDKRPRLTLKKSNTQRYLEFGTLLCLVFAVAYTIYNYTMLPEQVPMHFNASGEVDRYGSKNSIWVLLIIACVMCFGLYKLNKYPHLFNYPNVITKENAEAQYSSAVTMLSWLNFLMALLFALICYQIVSLAINGADKTAQWTKYLLYTIIAVMVIAPIFWAIKASSTSKK